MDRLSVTEVEYIKKIVQEAGHLARDYQSRELGVRRKIDSTIVTEADLAVQNYLVTNLRDRFPYLNFIHEENFDKASTVITEDTVSAIIDPIDGTAMYTMHLPLWCISVGIFHGYEPRYGFVYAPGSDMMFYCDDEHSYLNEREIQSLKNMSVDRETNIFYASEVRNIRLQNFPGKIRNLGSTAFHACLTIDNERNRVLAFIGRSFLWDWAGAIPIILKAGGHVRYLSGSTIDFPRVFNDGCSFKEDLIASGLDDLEKVSGYFRMEI